MRSRYTAFVVGDGDHLFRTWHPSTRPDDLDVAPDPGWRPEAPNAGTSNAPYAVYNIGNHQPVPLMRMIALLEAALGRQAVKTFLPMQPGDVRSTYADVESLQEAWIVASQFEGTGDVAQHKGLERIRQDAMIACQEHSLRLLRKCDDIPQSLLDGDSIGGYLRRRCPRVAQPSDGPTEFVAIAGTLLDSLGHAYRLAFSSLAQRCAQAERAHGIAGIEN